jgi:hypothetical protein
MAVIALDDPKIGQKTDWMGYMYIPAIKGTIANLAGYPTDLDHGLRLYYSSGPIDAATDHQVIFHFPDAKERAAPVSSGWSQTGPGRSSPSTPGRVTWTTRRAASTRRS